MEVPIGQGLYGECRIFGECICGLCSQIEFGSQSKGRPKLPTKTKHDDDIAADIEAIDREIAKNEHTPQSHPNECQHLRKSVQNFGTELQRYFCLDCSNDISE